MLELINAVRAQQGRSKLATDSRLQRVAQRHSEHMQALKRLSREGLGGADIGERLRAEGLAFSACCQSMAQGYRSEAELVDSWSKSESQSSSLLNPQTTHVGYARAGDFWTVIWVTMADATHVDKTLLQCMNDIRREFGTPRVELDDRLTRVAARHSRDLQARGVLDSRAADGSHTGQRLAAEGVRYTRCTVLVAKGHRSESGVVQAWMRSAGSRAHILNMRITHVGWGRADDYWAMVLAEVLNPYEEGGEMLELVNAVRVAHGLSRLAHDERLARAARKHSQEMFSRGNLQHEGADGSGPGNRLSAEGVSWMYCSENIAMGYATAQAAVDGWMGSPGHRKNLLNTSATHFGWGKAGVFWTQVFALVQNPVS